MIKTSIFSTILCCCVLVSGCAQRENISPVPSIPADAKRELEQPVNCNTAHSDIRILEEEKASVGKRALSGVRSIFPISAAAGILMGDYSDRVSVATGKYNDDIESKISHIKRRCGLK